jgi:hypothetical protein
VGEFPLAELSPGRYDLKLTVTDLSTKTNTSRQTTFVIR